MSSIPPPLTIKAPQNKRTHSVRVKILNNGLECLLINDPTIVSTAVSLSINAGSSVDKTPGLAHLMEHTIFTSSHTFPNPYHLPQTLVKVGGAVNAFTTYNQTNFYIEIPITSSTIHELIPEVSSEEPVLDYILGVFSAAFECPKFSLPLIKNEIFEINEEHLTNVSSTDKKFYHCLKLLSTSSFAKFGTGNSDTLNINEKELSTQLKHYFHKYFIPENMRLVIKGPQSLNHLQKLVQLKFQTLPHSKLRIPILMYPIFDLSSKNQLLYVKENTDKIRLIFPLTQLNDKLIQISKIWIELLGNEQSYSLCDYLVQENLVSEFLVFDQMVDTNNLLIVIEIKLTLVGKHQLVKTIGYVFTYIQFILDKKLSRIDRYIDEFLKLEKLSFIYKESDDDLMEEVSKLSELIHYLNYQDVFMGYKMCEITSNLFLIETQRYLSFDNFNIVLFSDFLDPNLVLQCTKKEIDQFYNFTYSQWTIDKTQLFLNSLTKLQFKFPPKNHFLTYSHHELDGLMVDISDSKLNYNVAYIDTEVPELIEYSKGFSGWYKSELNFNNKIYTTFEVVLALDPNCSHYMEIDILVELMGPFLIKNMYASESLGYTWSIFPSLNSKNSMCFNINGLKKDYLAVLQLFINHITRFLGNLDTIPYSKFMKARIKVRKNYEDMIKAGSFQQCLGLINCLMDKNVYSVEERLETLMEVELDQIGSLANKFVGEGNIKVLVNGDCNNEVDDIFQVIKNGWTLQESFGSNLGSYIPKEGKFRYEFPSNANNHCFFYIHLGMRDCVYTRTISKVLEYIISVHVPKLRFQRKLGYKIGSGLKIFRDTIGVFIYIESNEYNYSTLDRNIEDLLFEVYTIIKGYNSQEFQAEILIPWLDTMKSKPMGMSPNLVFDVEPSQCSTNFGSVSNNYYHHKSFWEKIVNETYRFGGKNGQEEVDLDLAGSITSLEVLKLFDDKISPKSCSRSVVLLTNKALISEQRSRRSSMKFWRKKDPELVEVLQECLVMGIEEFHRYCL